MTLDGKKKKTPLSLEEFLNYRLSGLFLIAGSSHCIGIDTNNGILYDPALPYGVTTMKSKPKKSSPTDLIRMCLGIKKGFFQCEIRRIVLIKQAMKKNNIN